MTFLFLEKEMSKEKVAIRKNFQKLLVYSLSKKDPGGSFFILLVDVVAEFGFFEFMYEVGDLVVG